MKNLVSMSVVFATFGLIIASIYGYIHNIIVLAGMTFSGHEGEALLRAIGTLVAPLGAIMGLFV